MCVGGCLLVWASLVVSFFGPFHGLWTAAQNDLLRASKSLGYQEAHLSVKPTLASQKGCFSTTMWQ